MNILVVDDHPVVRQGIHHLLASEIADGVFMEAANVCEAIRAATSNTPDVCVMDLSLGEESGLDLIRTFRREGVHCPVLVLSVFDEEQHAERALRSGAQGYLMKESAPDQLADAVRRVARGEIVVSKAVQSKLIGAAIGGRSDARGRESKLSEREIEVLDLIGQGLSTHEIADPLSRSMKTIESHRRSLQHKLELETGLQLTRYAVLRSRV